MTLEDQQEAALRIFETVRTKLMASQKDGDISNEQAYGRAYQRLVRLGLKPQIKKKYRKGI